MHILVSGGVAGTETARVIKAIVDTLIEGSVTKAAAHGRLQAFIDTYRMPRGRGRSPGWCVAENRVCDDHMRCFASDMLDLAPLLLSFLEDVMAPRELLVEHTQCYKALVRILEICTMGPRKGAARSVELRQSIIDHHALYRRLYPDFIKPKFHQLLHVPENAEQLGVLLSCFVNERKHRSIKSAAL